MALNVKKPGGASRGRAPSRRAINFADVGKVKKNYMKVVPYILILLIALGAFAKFFIIDKLDEVNREEQTTADLRSDLDRAQQRIDSFGDLADQYAHFTYSGMTGEELTRSDRVQILDMINSVVKSRGVRIDSWSVTGNLLTLYVTARDQTELNVLKNLMGADPRVELCTLKKYNTVDVPSDEDPDVTVSMMSGKYEVYMKATNLMQKEADSE